MQILNSKVRKFFPRKLAPSPSHALGTPSSKRINLLLSAMGGRVNYLEIGTQFGLTLEAVECQTKTGVDPNPKFSTKSIPANVKVFSQDSNSLFANCPLSESWNLIFLDGLHEFNQTLRDFENSIKFLASGGLIIIDDVLPDDRYSALPVQAQCNLERKLNGVNRRTWHGDVFKLVFLLSRYRENFDFYTFIYPGNPQTIVRLKDSDTTPGFSFDEKDIAEVQNLKFDDTFVNFQLVSQIYNFQFDHNLISTLFQI